MVDRHRSIPALTEPTPAKGVSADQYFYVPCADRIIKTEHSVGAATILCLLLSDPILPTALTGSNLQNIGSFAGEKRLLKYGVYDPASPAPFRVDGHLLGFSGNSSIPPPKVGLERGREAPSPAQPLSGTRRLSASQGRLAGSSVGVVLGYAEQVPNWVMEEVWRRCRYKSLPWHRFLVTLLMN